MTRTRAFFYVIAATALCFAHASASAAERPILKCPVPQKQVKNGARPDPALIALIVRCSKGEKEARPGLDGAVTIDVSAVQIGTPRKWAYSRDSGSGDPGTIVYPVRVTYTETTHYRTSKQVGENWIRVMNFSVDAFGEWQIGSEEHIKMPDNKTINF